MPVDGIGWTLFLILTLWLNELKDKGLITGSKGFSVKSLRESCKQYAQVDQSKEGSWLDNALKVEIEELCEYIPRIEFTAEDIKNASSGSEIKILKLENAIWGRPEVEGKMICEKYGVKVRTIELRNEEIDGVHVTKGKVGTGNNIIHTANYRNHFVPLLSNIEKDIKRSIKVSREEAYDYVIGSNSNNISQPYISTPSQDIGNFSHKQSSHSRSPGKGNREIGVSSGKRKRSVTDKDVRISKRLCKENHEIGVSSRKREHSVTDIDDIVSEKLRWHLDDKLCYSNETNQLEEKTLAQEQEGLLNSKKQTTAYSSDMPTLESETAKSNYRYWLSDQDIRRIVNVEYNNLYDIHTFSDNYENSAKGLVVISDQYLDSEIVQFKETFHDDSDVVSLRTFIINLRDNHWVTLVVLHQNGRYCGYYIDSLYDKDRAGNERNKIPNNISNILTNRSVKVKDLKIHQQDDNHNCGLFALENAKDINDVLRGSSVDEDEMLQRLQFPRDNYYFIERREYLTNKLNGDQRQEKNAMEGSVSTGDLQNDSPEVEVYKQAITDKGVRLPESDSCLQGSYDGLHGCDQYVFAKHKGYFNLIGITYQLQLLMLCFYRAFIVHKYDNFLLAAERVGVRKFDDIVLYNKSKAICIQVKHIDVERAYNSIGFIRLFPRGNRKWEGTFSVNKYFYSFIQSEAENVEYLVLYTNTGLDLTEKKELSRSKWSIEFFSLKFDSISIEEEKYEILKDCLYTGGNTEEHNFYKFSQEKTTRKKLLKLLDAPPFIVYDVKTLRKLKKNFLDKFIFAVNQPSREKLDSIIKREIEKDNQPDKVPQIYDKLYEGMLNYLKTSEGIYITKKNSRKFFKHAEERTNIGEILEQVTEKYTKATGLRNHTPHVMYKLELLMFSLYCMYKNKCNELYISAENGVVNVSGKVCFHYNGKVTYVWTRYGTEGYVDYSRLFPDKKGKHVEMFAINRYFISFIKELSTESEKMEYLVIYTNMGLNLTEEGKLEGASIRFNSIDIKKYSALRDYLCADDSRKEHGFYQFSRDKATRRELLKLLDSWPFSYDAEGLEEMKRNFLDKLVLAVNQPDREKLGSIIKHKIGENDRYVSPSKILRQYIALREVTLRWLGGYKIHYLTRRTMKELFKDIKNNKSSDQNTRITDENKDQFVRTIVADRGLCHFREFRGFLDTKEGEDMLSVLCKNKAEYNISNILAGTGIGVIDVFRGLYYMLFDKDGEKTDLLKILTENSITLSSISSMLNRAGNKAPEALKALHITLNTKLDNGGTYLELFVEKNIIKNISSILSGAGHAASGALEALCITLNTKLDNGKTYLEFFIEKSIMGNISSILSGAGDKAPEALEALCIMLNTKLDNGKTYLEFFTEKGIMRNISSILHGSEDKAPEALEALCIMLNTKLDNGKTYLEFFIEKSIMGNISSILSGAGDKAPEALEKLHIMLNTKLDDGETYLEFFVEKNVMKNISSMLSRAGDKAPKALEKLHIILNTKLDDGKTYLEFFVEKNIMGNISGMLSGAGHKAPKALEKLHIILNTKLDDGKTYLEFFVEKNIIKNISSMLGKAGNKAPGALKALCAILNKKLDNGKTYLEFFVNKKVMGNISSMLNGTGNKAPEALKALQIVLNTKLDDGKTYLEFFVEKNIMENISSMLNGTGNKAPEALKALQTVLSAKLDDGKTYLELFIEKNVMGSMSSMLSGTGDKAPEALKALYAVLSAKLDNGKSYLEFFIEKNVMGNISSILHGAGSKAPEALKALYAVLSTKLDDGKTYLEFFIEKNIMRNISSILHGAGSKAPEALKALYAVLSAKLDDGKTYLEFFAEKKIMGNISSMLSGAGNMAPKALEELYITLDTKLGDGKTYLEFFAEKKIMGNISSMLNRAGNKAPEALKALHAMLSIKLDDGKTYLEFFAEKNIMKSMSSMTSGAGYKAPEALKALHIALNTKLDNGKTYLEFFVEKGIIKNISSMLGGAGHKAPEALEALYAMLNVKLNNGKSCLEFFVEKKIMGNMSSMLSGAGHKAPEALKALQAILSTKLNDGKTYLEFFIEKKIMGNISSMLNRARHKAPEALEALCLVLNTKLDNGKTYLEFFVEKNIMGNISSILSGAGNKAPEALKALQAILSTKLNDGKTYLEFFIEKKVMRNISSMLSGAGYKAPEALKALYTILNIKLDNGKTYLEFFVEKKIMGNISSMLSGAGYKAPKALGELYNLLFNEKYSEHFANEGFELSNLSGMLHGTRARAPYILKRVHDLCFDVKGNKTRYFSDLIIANYEPVELFSMLRKVGMTFSAPLNEQNTSEIEDNDLTSVGFEPSNLLGKTKEQNSDGLQQSDSKTNRKIQSVLHNKEK